MCCLMGFLSADALYRLIGFRHLARVFNYLAWPPDGGWFFCLPYSAAMPVADAVLDYLSGAAETNHRLGAQIWVIFIAAEHAKCLFHLAVRKTGGALDGGL